jgi:hypothetical protein
MIAMKFQLFIPLCFLLVSCTQTRHQSLYQSSTETGVEWFSIPFDTDKNRTLTYQEAIGVYQLMAGQLPAICKLMEAGKTDIGLPLHVFYLSTSGVFDPETARKQGKLVVMINNGIHPGEPEGIDATVLFVREILKNKSLQEKYSDLVFVIIPVYNVDGCLNRSTTSRANQNGPESYGFRGNAKNLDLNRDFIKCDSENAQSFTSIFTQWKPEILIDNHTSNGSDYQYVMTLLPTFHAKLAPAQSTLLNTKMIPEIYTQMEQMGWPMAPYVNTVGAVPDSGIVAFIDYPRFATGYASLFHCIGFTPETHMLKPFAQRLRSTRDLMFTISDLAAHQKVALLHAKTEAQRFWRQSTALPLDWALDTVSTDSISFRGYEARYLPSKLHQGKRLFYDRTKPYTRKIAFYNGAKPKSIAKPPLAYIIPQAWQEVILRLRQNGLQYYPLAADTAFTVTLYRIKDFKTRNAYEGHYLHYQIAVDTIKTRAQFRKGDIYIPCDQDAIRYLVETLEPTAPDSWFAWNYFDGILMQKEYFSDYVFEDLAEQYLNENPKLRADLNEKLRLEPAFATDEEAVLDWIYKRSPWYEPNHKFYPVARIER